MQAAASNSERGLKNDRSFCNGRSAQGLRDVVSRTGPNGRSLGLTPTSMTHHAIHLCCHTPWPARTN